MQRDYNVWCCEKCWLVSGNKLKPYHAGKLVSSLELLWLWSYLYIFVHSKHEESKHVLKAEKIASSMA